MKKINQLIILLISILYIYSSDICFEDDVSSKSTCHDQTDESADLYCCYIKAKYDGETDTGCIPLSKAQKDDIGSYIKNMEKANNADVKSLDCKSSFMELGLFSLIFLLL
jgi:hypothetical protein